MDTAIIFQSLPCVNMGALLFWDKLLLCGINMVRTLVKVKTRSLISACWWLSHSVVSSCCLPQPCFLCLRIPSASLLSWTPLCPVLGDSSIHTRSLLAGKCVHYWALAKLVSEVELPYHLLLSQLSTKVLHITCCCLTLWLWENLLTRSSAKSPGIQESPSPGNTLAFVNQSLSS